MSNCQCCALESFAKVDKQNTNKTVVPKLSRPPSLTCILVHMDSQLLSFPSLGPLIYIIKSMSVQFGSICTLSLLQTHKGPFGSKLSLELPQGSLGVPEPHFDNHCNRMYNASVLTVTKHNVCFRSAVFNHFHIKANYYYCLFTSSSTIGPWTTC